MYTISVVIQLIRYRIYIIHAIMIILFALSAIIKIASGVCLIVFTFINAL